MEDQELQDLIQVYSAEQRWHEVAWLYRHAEKLNPKVIVEIGIKEGGNLKILSTLLPEEGLAIGIDPRKEIPWKMNDAKCKVSHIAGDSHSKDTIKKLVMLLKGQKIDLLFIDGDHSYQGMLQDFKDYSPFVRDGGIIAIHDIYYLEEVINAWRDLPVETTKYESLRTHDNIGIGFVYK